MWQNDKKWRIASLNVLISIYQISIQLPSELYLWNVSLKLETYKFSILYVWRKKNYTP